MFAAATCVNFLHFSLGDVADTCPQWVWVCQGMVTKAGGLFESSFAGSASSPNIPSKVRGPGCRSMCCYANTHTHTHTHTHVYTYIHIYYMHTCMHAYVHT
jgi:hypothetical protein